MNVEPRDIFVQRTDYKKEYIYTERKFYESELEKFVDSSTNIFISGETGSGKTWLFEIFLSKNNVDFQIIDLTESLFYDSLLQMLSIKILNSKGIPKDEIVEKCYQELSSRRKGKQFFIVFDNLETIVDSELFKKELSTLIHLLDSSAYSKYKIKFILVGIPSSLKEFFKDIKYFTPVANRISEVKKLNGLNQTELNDFIDKTFVKKLYFKISEASVKEIMMYTQSITDSMPLKVQQYLLILADNIIESNRIYNKDLLPKAGIEFLNAHYSEIETIMEAYFLLPSNKPQRRNQLIYLLGFIGHDNSFTIKSLQELFHKHFPKTIQDDLNITTYVSALTKGETPIVKKVDRSRFRLHNSNIKIWIKSMLYKDTEGIIRKYLK